MLAIRHAPPVLAVAILAAAAWLGRPAPELIASKSERSVIQPEPLVLLPIAKLDPASDAHYFAHDEQVLPRLVRAARRCTDDDPRGHEKALRRARIEFDERIRAGVVTFHRVRVVDSTLADWAVEACVVRAIEQLEWRDARFPDLDVSDAFVLRPWRRPRGCFGAAQ